MELTSCNSASPLISLDPHGEASILNYNLPQATCYEMTGYVLLDMDVKVFNPATLSEPPHNFWQQTSGLTPVQLTSFLQSEIAGAIKASLLQNNTECTAKRLFWVLFD